MKNLYSTHNGLITLGPDLVEIFDQLESIFLDWAAESDASSMQFPTLLPIEFMHQLDYFENFPHLGTVVSKVKPNKLETYAQGEVENGPIPAANMAESHFVLQPAACYNVYLHLQDQVLGRQHLITTRGHCFRNEKEFTGLTRLWGFHLREIVCVGTEEEAKEHLKESKNRLCAIAKALDLDLMIETATDPFFDDQSKRKLMQQLFPTKEEFLSPDSVAIASCNYHRNFFAERCNIRTTDGEFAHTSCVGFGIERWLHTLLNRYEHDVETIKKVCSAARVASAQIPT